MRTSSEAQLYAEALQHGFHMAWVRETYTIQDGMVFPGGGWKHPYIPLKCRELPTAIAKLQAGDERAVLWFVKRYGVLGYIRLADGGEPLAWIWAHAFVLRVIVRATVLLQEDNDEALEAFIAAAQSHLLEPETQGISCQSLWEHRKRMRQYYEYDVAGFAPHPPDTPVVAAFKAPGFVPLEASPPLSLRGCVRKIRSGLINQFMGPVYRQLWDYDGDKPVSTYRLSNTLSAAYWLLADMVEQGEDARLRRCAECHAWFIQTDGRQRFCPIPAGGKGESRCAARQRMRTHRQHRAVPKACG